MRIAFYGGPCCGKSTTTGRIFADLKELKYSVEPVSEYVKAWAYSGRQVKEFDQIYIFGKQQQYEFRWLSNGVKNIITDSPTFLSVFYSKLYISQEMADAIWTLCKLYDAKYPVFNIFLERGENMYDPTGRYQTEEEAKQIDNDMWNELIAHYPPEVCCRISVLDKAAILAKVLEVSDK